MHTLIRAFDADNAAVTAATVNAFLSQIEHKGRKRLTPDDVIRLRLVLEASDVAPPIDPEALVQQMQLDRERDADAAAEAIASEVGPRPVYRDGRWIAPDPELRTLADGEQQAA